ncbi:PREDICTED: DNA primase large subunit-like [Myotis davidii]|uniref:DNA primase large subunit-like n=1 Tax=Myotis davidii TaxID=225400 RepID=UPI000767C51B|nr:PREDICTED: DNA primase large subunit-like [Myotis davidii]
MTFHSYTGQDYSTLGSAGKISLDQIDSLCTKSFPPCMRQLHKALRDTHHLRHGGRMQYGLFLKGIGLTLEQALQFWKQEFIRGKMDPDKFDKGYSYNIRHSFGKEGKRTDYTPFSCLKIILNNPPGQGDYHGCPFRHSDPELLKQKLQSYKISPGGISQILDLVKGTHYQVACQKYFEITHNNFLYKSSWQDLTHRPQPTSGVDLERLATAAQRNLSLTVFPAENVILLLAATSCLSYYPSLVFICMKNLGYMVDP